MVLRPQPQILVELDGPSPALPLQVLPGKLL